MSGVKHIRIVLLVGAACISFDKIDKGKHVDLTGVASDMSNGQLGDACTSIDDCRSGFCADGVCCDEACTDSCVRCDGPTTKGMCTQSTTAPTPPRASCSGAVACAGACDG